MESLYRKYRPQTFADVVGQRHVVETLERAALEGRTSHAYLFCGPRGTGKTTMARLLAKALLCEQAPGQLPDGTCEKCQLIAAGEHPDVYELDAASRTGVDSVREEIINNVSYAPTRGAYKVYIIDEVHMLTSAAFNALLKTLEEPPGHVLFVLCTTDPQKIPPTILSRVQRFDFRPIGDDDIRRHLTYVCEQEGFTYEDAALDLVTTHARGGMRDALSTLEQLSVFGGGVIGYQAAQDLLGAVSDSMLGQVVEAMAARDVPALFVRVGELVNAGRDLLQFTRELAEHLRDVYVAQVAGANPVVLPAGADAAQLAAEAAAFGSADRLARILAELGDVSRQMSTTPNQRLALEIAFTRIARPEADLTLESLAERLAELEGRVASGVIAATQQPVARAAAQPVAQPAAQTAAQPAAQSASAQAQTKPPEPVQTAPAQEPASRSAAARPAAAQPAAVQPAAAQPATSQPAQRHSRPAQPASQQMHTPQSVSQSQPAQHARAQSVAQGALTDPGALQRAWRQVVSGLMERIPARGTLLSNAQAVSDDGEVLVVSLPKGSSFALKMLERPDVRAAVEASVEQAFGHRTITYKEDTGTSLQLPDQRAAKPRRQTPQNAWSQQAQAAPQHSAGMPAASASQPVSPAPEPNTAFVSKRQPEQHAPASASGPQVDYPMPWEDVPASQQEEPYREEVPYEELGGLSTGEFEDEVSVPVTPALADPATPAQRDTTPAQPTATPAVPVAPSASETIESSQPTPKPASASPSSQLDAPDDLPPELVNILENAFEVFGSDVRVTKDSS